MAGTNQLRRSNDKVIAGVCAGFAEYYGWKPNRVRLIFTLVSILSAAFPGTLVYIVLWFLMPNPDA